MYEKVFSSLNEISRTKLAISLVIIALIATSIGYFSIDQPKENKENPKVALIVFDGGDWLVVNRLIEQERVPEIKRTMEKGVYANFSAPRAFSPMSWTKIATGQKDEDLGVQGWNSVNDEGRTRLIQSSDVKNYRVWNYLNSYNISTGVVNYLLTWPVEPVKGFLVADTLARGPEQTYPSDFGSEDLKQKTEWEKARYILRNHKDEVSFLTLGFKRVDGIQHHLWKFVEPGPFGLEWREEDDKYREVVYSEYENLDQVMSRFDDSWNVIVVSDSGFQPEGMNEPGDTSPTNAFNLDPLIEKMGYADFDIVTNYGQKLYQINKRKSKLQRELFRYPKKPEINSTHYRFKLRIIDDELDINQTVKDFQSVEYTNGEDFFYDVEYVERNDSSDLIRGKYIIYPDQINESRIKEDYINHPTIRKPLVHAENAVTLKLNTGEIFKWWSEAEQSGDHPPGATYGIFFARGPAIKDGGRLPTASINTMDITPTILYMYGKPIPTDMEGKAKTEIFTDEFNKNREVKHVDTSTLKEDGVKYSDPNPDTEKAIKERLRQLGYTVR